MIFLAVGLAEGASYNLLRHTPVAAQKIRPHYDKLTHPRRDLWSTAWKNHHGRPGYAVLRS